MIDFYTLTSPNVRKVHLMLEECGLDYEMKLVDVWKGDNFQPEFLKLNPNAKIPVIVDHDGIDGKSITIFESGAILLYLAEKTGRFMPTELRARYQAMQWLLVQVGTQGPMFGQLGFFSWSAKERSEEAIARYTTELRRILKMIDERLGTSEFIATGEYSIVDMMFYPWVGVRSSAARIGYDIDAYPNLARWANAIADRPASQRVNEMISKIQSVRDNPDPEDFDRLWRRSDAAAR